ncbi:sodium pump decarboxylase subunit gamma [Chlorobium phaeovibrioides]|uniref:Sodium pump decarboxylase subunit gamma n=1 Tax=Chlorobium phaeovibrioides TaxID=1094 RepID=A0A432AWX3_CHLPH|nr:OadG family protein [Chlorobium phaeovibrioides]KAA6232706.1 sodium pump decarboxylase subunit gamma [Chlorobium phaeovibrioides]MWV53788.1 sodium pump decarboxylase subunit gamma [Chlorobium phaeovibrioides]QEQ56902.1 sodium pump decarboxylase subunit gamma [Chlorobium phaeovibrioides]RTY37356.1 sodium pump decarboxylase subunit gamma [Chlorobium phaeovibrioides]RTY39851.1 sodium pump decarboxylase subunit gamma [Chlorobium phaeovibrioides]
MVFDGLILMVVGMLTVSLFLVLMVVIISVLSSIFKEHALGEEKRILDDIEDKRKKKRAKEAKKAGSPDSGFEAARMAAVISAAVTAHRQHQAG